MKDLFDKLFSIPSILLIILILVVIFLLFTKREKQDFPMTGKHHSSLDPNAPKDIASLELKNFTLLINDRSLEISGNVEISLAAYDNSDTRLLENAGDKIDDFKKLGYMLWISASSNNDDYVQLKVAVDKEFVTEIASLIRQSGVMTLNGKYDWTDGIPEDAGVFMLSAKYQTGEKLNVTINATVPISGIELFKLLKPLLINKMLEQDSNYIALLNFNRDLINPETLVSSINISQSDISFNLKIIDAVGYLSSNYINSDNNFHCDAIQIDNSDLEIILNALVNTRFVFVTDKYLKEDTSGIYDKSTSIYYIYFKNLAEGYHPINGDYGEDYQDLVFIFMEMVKKYSK